MKEIFESFMDSSRERIKNPIIGSFATSFIIYNWKAIVFLMFSKASIEDRIIVIKTDYSTIDSILVPIIIALCYILLLPYFSAILDNLLFKIFTTRANQKNKFKLVSLNNKKETAKIERELADIRAGTKDIEELHHKNSELEFEIGAAQIDIEQLKSEKARMNSEITNLTNSKNTLENLLEDYRNLGEPTNEYVQKISKELGRNRLRRFRSFCNSKIFNHHGTEQPDIDPVDVDLFKRMHLIYVHDNIYAPLNYALTPLGFKLYVESGNASL